MTDRGALPELPCPPEFIIRVMLTFDRAADDHLGDCARRGFTPRTLATYGRTYDIFGARLPRDQDVSKVTTDDIRRFLNAHSHLASGTIAGFEAHLASLFKQLYLDSKIARNPMDRLPRTRRKRAEDLDVVTVDAAGVRKLLTAGVTWTERLAPAVPAYLGPRRRAIASLRLTDYDRGRGRMRFREKGGKVIWKPVPDDLARLIAAADAAGAYDRYDYIVPPEGYLSRKGDRDDRVIWRVIRRLADRTGVRCHVHALRAAFAVFYLEQNPGDMEALQELMGHRSSETTRRYLRMLNRDRAMDRVRSLSWGVALEGDTVAARSPLFAENTFASSPVMGAGGFEPPLADIPVGEPHGGEHILDGPARAKLDELRDAARKGARR